MRPVMTSSDLPRILVVDDEPLAVELMVRSLRKLGRVETARSGDEAWSRCQGGDFALIVSDQRMPGITGVDLLSRVAELDQTAGRILLTGYSDLEATVQAINRGRVHAYLHKPCAPPDLIATVTGVLDRVGLARENLRLVVELQQRNDDLDRALESLRSAQGRIVTSESLAAVGRMTAMITHDLRTPLTVLLGVGHELSELAAAGGPSKLGALSEELDCETRRMRQMCEELLEVTRASKSSRGRCLELLDEVVHAAVAALIEPASLQGVELDLQLVSKVSVPVDEDGLGRALRNLVQNALDVLADGGAIRIETSVDREHAIIRVTDNGPGVPDEIADRLFDAFVTSGKVGGTGLGLAIVQKVARDHGGTISVEKPEGGGTCFVIALPMNESDSA